MADVAYMPIFGEGKYYLDFQQQLLCCQFSVQNGWLVSQRVKRP